MMLRRPGKRPLILGCASVLVLTCGLLSCVACAMPPGPRATKDQIAMLSRGEARDGDNRRISYLHGGSKEERRVIYIHGTPGNATAWTDFVVEPLEGTESVAVDRPGFGESAESGAVPSIREQAAALEPFLVQRKGEWPILVGHSLGGPIAARAAADYPDRVGGLVIVAGSLDPELEKVYAVQHAGEWKAVSWLMPSALKHSNRELIPLEGELRMLEPLLSTIACPVVIVHGTEDGLVPYENVAFMQRHFPPENIVDVITLEGANHFLPWNAEEKVREAIRLLSGSP